MVAPGVTQAACTVVTLTVPSSRCRQVSSVRVACSQLVPSWPQHSQVAAVIAEPSVLSPVHATTAVAVKLRHTYPGSATALLHMQALSITWLPGVQRLVTCVTTPKWACRKHVYSTPGAKTQPVPSSPQHSQGFATLAPSAFTHTGSGAAPLSRQTWPTVVIGTPLHTQDDKTTALPKTHGSATLVTVPMPPSGRPSLSSSGSMLSGMPSPSPSVHSVGSLGNQSSLSGTASLS